jgi:predicted metal-dependent peptidase
MTFRHMTENEEELTVDDIVKPEDFKGPIPFEDYIGKNIKSGDFDMDRFAYKLMAEHTEYSFFAGLFMSLTKRPTYALPTAGVRLNPTTHNYELFYNPQFMNAIAFDRVRGIIIHELYHILLEHCDGRAPEDEDIKKIANIAMDLAINCRLPRNWLPDKILTKEGKVEPFNPCVPGEGKFGNLPADKAYEWYAKKLIEDGFEPDQNGFGDGQMDSHDGFDEGDESGEGVSEARATAKQKLKNAIEKSTEAAIKTNSWGNMPADMKADLIARLTPRVNWRALLREFIGRAQKADRFSSHRKVNKKFPYILPGKRARRHANIAISIDQSGSVDDGMLILFFSELKKLADYVTFTVIPFDTEVDPTLVYKWKKGTVHKVERVKCGGTDFNAPTEYVNKSAEFDGHIICTDMMAPQPIPSKVPRIWMTTEECRKSMPFTTNERIMEVTRKELDKLANGSL